MTNFHQKPGLSPSTWFRRHIHTYIEAMAMIAVCVSNRYCWHVDMLTLVIRDHLGPPGRLPPGFQNISVEISNQILIFQGLTTCITSLPSPAVYFESFTTSGHLLQCSEKDGWNSDQLILPVGLPWWLSGKESACQCKRHSFNPWVGKIPWRRKWQSTLVFMPGKSHGQRTLVGYTVHGVAKSWTRFSN